MHKTNKVDSKHPELCKSRGKPKMARSEVNTGKPMYAELRSDKEEPRMVRSTTDNKETKPMHEIPITGSPESDQAKDLTEVEEPTCAMLKEKTARSDLTKDLKGIKLPQSLRSNTKNDKPRQVTPKMGDVESGRKYDLEGGVDSRADASSTKVMDSAQA